MRSTFVPVTFKNNPKMKTRIMMLLLCVSMVFFTTVSAQHITIVTPDDLKKGEIIDTTLFRVQYKLTTKEDTLAKDKQPVKETMMLEVGRKLSLFYSYTQYILDSVMVDDMTKGASQEEFMQHARQYGGGNVTYRIYKNYPAGKVTTLDKLGISKFRCEEINDLPQWQLKSDTITILSYLCHKATCHFKGRTYEAWYTLEIPRSEGPWKLTGLPGLILKAKDRGETYIFECTGVEQCRNNETIMLAGGTFEPVNRKALNKIYERYAKDPVGFITSTQPGVHIKVTDEHGNENVKTPKDLPYNPIELSDK